MLTRFRSAWIIPAYRRSTVFYVAFIVALGAVLARYHHASAVKAGLLGFGIITVVYVLIWQMAERRAPFVRAYQQHAANTRSPDL